MYLDYFTITLLLNLNIMMGIVKFFPPPPVSPNYGLQGF